MVVESEPRRSCERPGDLVTVDIERPPASGQLDKWEPRRAAAPVDAAACDSVEEAISLGSGSASGSCADSDDLEAQEIVERMTGETTGTAAAASAEASSRPYLAALEALGSQLSGGPEANSVNIGNNIIKDTGSVHVGPYTVNKFLGNIQIGTVTYANSAAVEGEAAGKQAEAEASEPRHKLSTTSDHPFFPLSQARVAEWLWTRKCIVSIIVAAVLLIVVIVVTLALTLDPVIPGVRIVGRVMWGAQPPKEPPAPLATIPAPYVIISHTATDFCFTQSQCVMHVRFAQTFHMESFGWNDIGYNFLVGGDGNAYEGRGWGIEGAHAFNFNKISIGISFIGTFDKVKPTKAQLHAARKLIELGVEGGHVARDYKLLGHRQCTKTESPGQALYEIIQTWEHWVPKPDLGALEPKP